MTAAPAAAPPRDLRRTLARYRAPDERGSLLEIAITAVPFMVLWIAAWQSLAVGYWLTLLITLPLALLLVRLFLIQHDCGHGAFFRNQSVNDWVGRTIGVVTLTPYKVWRRSHAMHHAASGNLDRRGMGDIDTLTVREYQALPGWRRLAYRLYRNPLVMLGVGPAFVFLVMNRLPFGQMGDGWGVWLSAMGTNVAIVLVAGGMILAVGAEPFLLVQLPATLLAATIGVWLFYVQHQFEDTYWADGESWQFEDAAMHGSSHYVMPPVLSWFTANIGVHHVHHASSRIPYYRLPEVLRDHPALGEMRRLTFRESLACLRLRLWDENSRRLVSLREAMARRGDE